MSTELKTEDARTRHRRRVHIALWVSNAIVVNDLAFAFCSGGFRVPVPALEHYGRLLVFSLPAIFRYSIHPGRQVTALRLLGAALKAPFVILLNAFAGGVILLVAAALATITVRGGLPLILLLILMLFAVVTALWLGIPRWRHLPHPTWLAPACAAFLCIAYMPPSVITSLEGADGYYVVEAGQVCLPSDPVIHICAATPVLSGMFEWWRVLGTLPSHAHGVTMRREGADLVIEYTTWNDAAPHRTPVTRRYRIQ